MIEIRLEEISKAYAQGAASGLVLEKINLVIEPGEFFFLLGPSGCGKTTLLRILAGLLEPSGGRILFDGRDVTHLAAEKRRTAMVFQNYALWPHLKVIENVEFGPQMQGMDPARRRQMAMEKLAVVQMEAFAHRKPNQLSGGQQQRVAVARALAAQPECLLLDEPLSNLDARLRAKMRTELRRLVKESKTTAVYVTHDQKEALSMADRIAVLCGGRIVQLGRPEEIYQRPKNEFVADFIGEANFLTGNLLQTRPLKIRTEAGILASDMTIERPAGAVVKCCVRPEKVQIYNPKDFADRNRPNLLAGTVLNVVYYGELSQIEVRLTAEVVWTVTVFSDRAMGLTAGTEVLCGIHPADVIVLEG